MATTWNSNGTVSGTNNDTGSIQYIHDSRASNGDTITIPPGPFIWNSAPNITKSITIQGAGIDSTNITGGSAIGTGSLWVIGISKAAGTLVTIGGMTLRGYQGGGANPGLVRASCLDSAGFPPVAVRVTNCKFLRDSVIGGANRAVVFNSVYGVVDNCTIIGVSQAGQGIFNMEPLGDQFLSNNWHVSNPLGTDKAMVIEDCTINTNTMIDSIFDGSAGSKGVVRYCNITNGGSIGNHGFDSAYRSGLSVEAYNNVVTTNIADASSMFFAELRGGTGVVYNNVISGPTRYAGFYLLRYYRSMTDYQYIILTGGVGAADSGRDTTLLNSPIAYYPASTWGSPVASVNNVTGIAFNKLTGVNPVDCNIQGANHFDPALSTTYTDVTTFANSNVISSTTAAFSASNFTNRDEYRDVTGTNIRGRRYISDGSISGSSLTSTAATWNQGDVGRFIIAYGLYHATITSVAGNVATLNRSDIPSGSSLAIKISGAFIVSESSGSATLNCKVPASGTNTSLTIGYLDTGYPLLDQPGFGPFPSANAGNWPNNTSYTLGNYEQPEPTYQWNNNYYGNTSPTTLVAYRGNEAYIKSGREYFDNVGAKPGYVALVHPHPLVSGALPPTNTPPTISNIANQSTAFNTPTSAISFTIGDAETSAGSLSVIGTSSNSALVPNSNIVFGGSGANRTVTITPASGQFGATTISVIVSDGTFTSSDTFVLTVTGDITPPAVIITSPANGAPVSGTITITATASDNVAVAGVQFRRDGVNVGTEDTSPPYSANLDTTVLTNGPHVITAVARDTSNNTFTSPAVTINVSNVPVSDTIQPTVSITSPSNLAIVSGTISVTAIASDNVAVAGVQFKLDGVNMGSEDLTSPYSISWDTTTTANGPHAITATARDTSSNTRVSTVITVTVSNVVSDPGPGSGGGGGHGKKGKKKGSTGRRRLR